MKVKKMALCRRAVFMCVIVITSAVVAKERAGTESRSKQYMPGVVIVKIKDRVGTGQSVPSLRKSAAIAGIIQRYSATASRRPFLTPGSVPAPGEEEFSRIFELAVPSPVSIPAMIRELQQNPDVEYAEPKYVHHTNAIPNDPMYGTLWHLATIKAAQAWDITKGDSAVVIGIVDTGTDYTHPDIAANVWTNPGETGLDARGSDKRTNGIDDDNNGYVDDWRGWDFVGATAVSLKADNDPNPYNGNPHGTHTAGIACAVTANGIGVASIGWKTKFMITKHGIDTPGSDLIIEGDDGILYCINNGAAIVSCSWGGGGSPSQYEQDIVKYALKKNVLIVAAAGNGGADELSDDVAVQPEYPAACNGVLSVGATDSQDKITFFSNYGAPPRFKVFAPGLGILSTIPGNSYASYSGTSMATPLVAGLAALVKAVHPTWTPAQLMFQLCGTADNIDAKNSTLIGKLGFGRINAYRALTETVPVQAPAIAVVSVSVDDSKRGNGNMMLEPGEQTDIILTIENQWGDAQNVVATLETSSWSASITKATSTYGTVRGIAAIDSSTRSNAGDPFRISINAQAFPAVVPFTLHVSTSNGANTDYTFSLPILPSVLLVDDDDGVLNVETYYTSALDSLGVVYEHWDHAAKGTPPLALMMRYKTIIWFTEWNVPTLDSADRSVLAQYLVSGGKKLFLSGQENAWDLCGTDGGNEYEYSAGASKTFYETYLKGKFLLDDAGTFAVKGVTGDEIGNGLAFTRNEPLREAAQNPDVIAPNGGSSAILTYVGGAGDAKAAGIKYKGADYTLVSLSFGGYESITDQTQRKTVMDRVLKYLYGYDLTVSVLADYPPQPFTINATVTSGDANASVELLWSVDGVLPYHRVTMTKTSGVLSTGANYTGAITPSAGTRIQYFVLVHTGDGFLPYTIHSFAVNIQTDVKTDEVSVPHEFSMSQNFPNPFNPSTRITYEIAETRFVSLKVYDALGREVAVLVNGVRTPGRYDAEWHTGDRASGIYYYTLTAGPSRFIKKMTLLR